MPSPILQYNRPVRYGGDPDVLTFEEYGISLGETPLSSDISAALNRFVTYLKAQNLWNSYRAIYPIVGGTTAWHSLNLKDPTTFRMIQNGTVVNDVNGTQGNGVNGYWDSGFDIAGIDSGFACAYIRTDLESNDMYDFGQVNTSIGETFSLQSLIVGGTTVGVWGGGVFASNISSLGFFICGGAKSSTNFVIKNGIRIGDDFAQDWSPEGKTLYFMANNSEGVMTGNSSRQYSFFGIVDQYTSGDEIIHNIAVQNLQSALGRQV